MLKLEFSMNQHQENIGNSNPFEKSSQEVLPRVLPVRLNGIPQELKDIPRWVMWKLIKRSKPNGEKAWTKMPLAIDGGPGSSTNSRTWSTYNEVCDALIMGKGFDGIGLVLGADVQGIDLDDCRSPDGSLTELATEMLDRVDGYAEVSPSGTGIKIFARTNLDRSRTKKELGVELYREGRYFTVTGHQINGHASMSDETQDLGWFVERVWGESLADGAGGGDAGEMALALYKPQLEGWDLDRVIQEVLPHLDPDGGYEDWLKVGAALHHQGGGEPEWLDAWDNWSAMSGKWVDGYCADKWSSFSEQRAIGNGSVTLASLLWKTKDKRDSGKHRTSDGTHVLARFVEIDGVLKQPRWVIPGFISTGVVVIAGTHGVGKTTAILPLAMIAAGLITSELAPVHWMHVIYVTEDVEQAKRIITGILNHGEVGALIDQVRERLHIVEAVRLEPNAVAEVGAIYKNEFVRDVEGIKVQPLVVFDTKSAVLAQDNENDNAEASAMMAAMKQAFNGISIWLIGHTAKDSMNRKDIKSSRGASAVDADANQTIFLIADNEKRYLVQGKTRFDPKWPELQIISHTYEAIAPDEFGNYQSLTLRWGIAAPTMLNRKEAIKQAAEIARIEQNASLQQEIIFLVEEAWLEGTPLNKTSVTKQVKRKKSEVIAMLDSLLARGKFHEIPVPSQLRANNSKSCFLVSLTDEEQAVYVRNGTIPSAKKTIPPTWRKDHD
jgi:RecA-family ATPase